MSTITINDSEYKLPLNLAGFASDNIEKINPDSQKTYRQLAAETINQKGVFFIAVIHQITKKSRNMSVSHYTVADGTTTMKWVFSKGMPKAPELGYNILDIFYYAIFNPNMSISFVGRESDRANLPKLTFMRETLKLAEQGDSNAQLRLAKILFRGELGQKHPENALFFLRKALSQNNPGAYTFYAQLQLDGSAAPLIPKNEELALKNLDYAINQNETHAMRILAGLIKHDRARSIAYLKKAADLGDGLAAVVLVNDFYTDSKDPAEKAQCFKYLQQVVKTNFAPEINTAKAATFYLIAKCYQFGSIYGAPFCLKLAAKYYKLACMSGFQKAQKHLKQFEAQMHPREQLFQMKPQYASNEDYARLTSSPLWNSGMIIESDNYRTTFDLSEADQFPLSTTFNFDTASLIHQKDSDILFEEALSIFSKNNIVFNEETKTFYHNYNNVLIQAQGKSCSQELSLSANLLECSANAGHKKAQELLAHIYRLGLFNKPRSSELFVKYIELAYSDIAKSKDNKADQEVLSAAYFNHAVELYNGSRQVAPNREEALKFMLLASRTPGKTQSASWLILARWYASGIYALVEQEIDRDNAGVGFDMNFYFSNEFKSTMSDDLNKSGGEISKFSESKQLIRKQIISPDPKMGLAYLNRAVQAELPQAIIELGEAYEKGLYGLKINYTLAVELYEKALLKHPAASTHLKRAKTLECASKGDRNAMIELGHGHENGLWGLPKNFVLAAQWYQQAKRYGHPNAEAALEGLNRVRLALEEDEMTVDESADDRDPSTAFADWEVHFSLSKKGDFTMIPNATNIPFYDLGILSPQHFAPLRKLESEAPDAMNVDQVGTGEMPPLAVKSKDLVGFRNTKK